MAEPAANIEDILLAHARFRQNQNEGCQADLSGQDLSGLSLPGYTLDGAILRNVKFAGADFTGATLSGADVSGADFRGATISKEQALSAKGWLLAQWSPVLLNALGLNHDHNERLQFKDFHGYSLPGANLRDLDLSGADLMDTMLDKADLSGANLEFTRLGDASLKGAILTGTHGLNAYQLRGANLTLAQLPTEIAESLKTMPGVDEATKTSRKVFLTMLAACLYCWLTILSATDAGLLIGNSTLALPVVQTPIPVVAFFGAAPVLLLIVYLYLHFSLQNLWEALATLPAIFPDGRPLHERAMPWILSPIVRLYYPNLKERFGQRLPEFQVRATALLAWSGVPITLLAFWLRFLVRHNPFISGLHAILVGISVWLALMLWKMTLDTLRGRNAARPRLHRALRSWAVFAGLISGALLALITADTLRSESLGRGRFGPLTIGPRLQILFGWDAFGDLRGADLSRKPDGWDGKNLAAVKGAQLRGRNLNGVDASGSFGVKADFAGADLRNATLGFADLRGAIFVHTHLEHAAFVRADLRTATFDDVDIRQTYFPGANLKDATFAANVHPAIWHIRSARNGFLAHFGDDAARRLSMCGNLPGQPCDHEDRVRRRDFSGIDLRQWDSFSDADLSGANLQYADLPRDLEGADLSKADLRNARLGAVPGTMFYGANLTGADLRGVNLKNALGLTQQQIESAITDKKTLLPAYLEAQKPFTPAIR